jgi:hypothetical protein
MEAAKAQNGAVEPQEKKKKRKGLVNTIMNLRVS